MTRRWAIAVVVLVACFAAVVVAGQTIIRPSDNVSSPSHSRLRFVEDVFPPRELRPGDIRRGGPNCLQGRTLVISTGGGCTFIVPKGVHVALFRRVPNSGAMNLTVTQTVDLTQSVDTGRPGPDPDDPLLLRLAVVHDGTTVTLSGCLPPGPCRLDVVRER